MSVSIPKQVVEESGEIVKDTARQAKGILPDMIHSAWEQILGKSKFKTQNSKIQTKNQKLGRTGVDGEKASDALRKMAIQRYFQALIKGQKELKMQNEKSKIKEKERVEKEMEERKKAEEKGKMIVLPKSVARMFGAVKNWRKAFGSKGKMEIKGGISG